MELSLKNIQTIISQSNQNLIEWYKYGDAPCFNCDIEGETIIICKYTNRNNQQEISLTCTDDWGNITSENYLTDGDIFKELSIFYDIIRQQVRVEI